MGFVTNLILLSTELLWDFGVARENHEKRVLHGITQCGTPVAL